MAIYHLHIKTFNRASGSNAAAAAAYRAGERLRDERSGRTYNFSRRRDVLHKEIVLPPKFDGVSMAWARDRASLWSSVELAGLRSNSRLAREFQVSLPHELTHEQQVGLVRGFSRELAGRYGAAVDATIHGPRPNNDARNFHAHLLATTREVTDHGLGARTHLDISNLARTARGLQSSSQEFRTVRKLWADLTNKALEQANVAARIDHRSLKEQGIDRASKHVKAAVYRQVMEERAAAKQSIAAPKIAVPKTLEDIRREAQERWYQVRSQSLTRTARRGRGDDFGL